MAFHYGTTPTCGCPYTGPGVVTAEKGSYAWWVNHLPRCAQYDPEEAARQAELEQKTKDLHAWR